MVAPELDRHLVLVYTELFGVAGSELTERETPALKSGSERDSTLLRLDLDVSESSVVSSQDGDVHQLDGTEE